MMGSLPPLNFAVRGSLDKRPSRPNQAPPEVITPNKRRRSPHDSEKDTPKSKKKQFEAVRNRNLVHPLDYSIGKRGIEGLVEFRTDVIFIISKKITGT